MTASPLVLILLDLGLVSSKMDDFLIGTSWP
jgi:hypothetical protein